MKEINDTNPIQTNIPQSQLFPTQGSRTTNNVRGHQYTELDSDLVDEGDERFSFIHESFENLPNFEEEASRELIGISSELINPQIGANAEINEIEDLDNLDDLDMNDDMAEMDELLDLEIGNEINELKAIQEEQEGIVVGQKATETEQKGTEQILTDREKESIEAEKELIEAEKELNGSYKKRIEYEKHTEIDDNIQVTQVHKFENLEDLCEGIEIIYLENGTALKDSSLFGEILENYSPTTRDPSEFIDYIFDELQKHEGFFKKLPTGELVPLTKEEIEAFKGQFTANLTTYFHQKYDIKIQLIQEKKDSDSNAKSSSLIDRGEKLAENRTTCTVRDIRSPEYRDKAERILICDFDFTTTKKIKIILIEKRESEKQEEKRDEKVQILADSIKKAILSYEILTRERLTDEINGLELKSSLSKEIKIPLRLKVKINLIVRRLDNSTFLRSESVQQMFPDLYKVKHLGGAA